MEKNNFFRDSIKKHGKVLLSILLLTLLIQTVMMLRNPVIAIDGIRYIEMAKRLERAYSSGQLYNELSRHDHAGFRVLIIMGQSLYRAFGLSGERDSWVFGAHFFPFIFGVFSVGLVWLLTLRLFSLGPAVVASLLFAVFPLFRRNAVEAFSDTPCLFFYLLSVCCLTEGILRKNVFWVVGAVCASGVSHWIRSEGIEAGVVAIIVFFILLFSKVNRRFAIVGFVCTLILVLIMKSPFMYLKQRLFTEKNLMVLFDPYDSFPPKSDTVPFTAPMPVVFNRFKEGCAEILGEYVEEGLRYVMLLPLIGGLFVSLRRESKVNLRLLFVVLFCFHCLVLLLYIFYKGHISHRHIMFLSLLSMPWIGFGTVALSALFFRKVHNRRFWPRACSEKRVLAGVVCCMTIGFFPKTFEPLHEEKVPMLAVAEWVKRHTVPDDQIASTSEYVFFYGEREGKWVDRPERGLRLRAKNTQELLYDMIIAEGIRPRKWLGNAKKHYEEKKVPGISGGPREIIIMVPKRQK